MAEWNLKAVAFQQKHVEKTAGVGTRKRKTMLFSATRHLFGLGVLSNESGLPVEIQLFKGVLNIQ